MSSLEIGREEAFHLRHSEENTLGRVWPVSRNWGPKSESPAFCSMAEDLVANSNHLSTLVLQLLHSDSTHRHKRILQPSWTTVIAVEVGNPTCIFFFSYHLFKGRCSIHEASSSLTSRISSAFLLKVASVSFSLLLFIYPKGLHM